MQPLFEPLRLGLAQPEQHTRQVLYNFSDQFSRYLAHMDKVLQKKRIPAKFIRWETNRPRNKSDECIWSDPELKDDAVDHLRSNLRLLRLLSRVP